MQYSQKSQAPKLSCGKMRLLLSVKMFESSSFGCHLRFSDGDACCWRPWFLFSFRFWPRTGDLCLYESFFSCRLSLAIKCTCLRVGHNWQLPVLIGQGPFFASCACVCWPLDMHVTNTRSRFEWKAFPTFGAALPLFSLAAPKMGLIVESLATICWKAEFKVKPSRAWNFVCLTAVWVRQINYIKHANLICPNRKSGSVRDEWMWKLVNWRLPAVLMADCAGW